MNKKERLVAAIENGTVIDHIPAEKTYQVVSLLELDKLPEPVTIGSNYPSKKIGKKGIIKVTDKFFTDEEISRLSVVAPKVVLSVIRDYQVTEKKTVETPDELKGIIRCNNPKCITNNEPMQTIFHVVNKLHGRIGVNKEKSAIYIHDCQIFFVTSTHGNKQTESPHPISVNFLSDCYAYRPLGGNPKKRQVQRMVHIFFIFIF